MYVSLPAELFADGKPRIWKLIHTLYGLNRAPKAFYDQLTAFLISHKYQRSEYDPCLFYRLYPKGEHIYFCLHVDDFAIASSSQAPVKELCDILKTRYTITESGNLESFLRILIVQEDACLYLSHLDHIAKCAKEAEISLTTKPVHIPMQPTFDDIDQNNSPPADKGKYAALLGMLIYVLRTRQT